MLRLQLLGGFSIANGATRMESVRLGSRQALLAVIACAGENGVTRDRLFALFWPESDGSHARRALNQALYTLRRELDAPAVTLGVDALRLNGDVMRSDVADFQAAVRAQDYEQCLALYGGALLDGLHLNGQQEFERWLDGERARLASAYRTAIEQVARGAERAGDWARAAQLWQRAAAADRLSTTIALEVINALARAGDRSAALHHAHAFQALVRAELDAEPDPPVEALAARIRAGETLLIASVPYGTTEGVSPVTTGKPADGVHPRAAPVHTSRRSHWARWALSAALFAVIGVAAWPRRTVDSGGVIRFTIGLAGGLRIAEVPAPMALSPDGKIVALVAARDSERPRIFVRRVSELDPRPIPGTDGASQPFFSPDGEWVGFYADGQLKKVRTAGTDLVRLADVPRMYGASWGRDGIVLSTRGSLARVSSDGGPLQPISTPDSASGELEQRWPLWLRNGAVVYASRVRNLEESRLAVVKPGTRQAILEAAGKGTAPIAQVGDALIYSSANNPGTNTNSLMALPFDGDRLRAVGTPTLIVDRVAIDVQGGVAASVSRTGALAYYSGFELRRQVIVADSAGRSQVLIGEPAPYAFPRFSPDARRIAVNLVGPPYDNRVVIFDRTSGTTASLSEGHAGYPEWTPDGKRILFLRPPGNGGLWSRPVGLGEPERLFAHSTSLDIKEGVLSPDGNTLVVRANNLSTNRRELWFRRTTGDTTWHPLVQSPGTIVAPRISPDGRWVAYAAADSASSQVFVTALAEGRPKIQVSLDRGWSPMWSPRGDVLYYVRATQLVAAAMSFNGTPRVTSRRALFDGGFDPQQGFHAQYDVAPNGREFLMLRNVGAPQAIVFVHDWRHEVRLR